MRKIVGADDARQYRRDRRNRRTGGGELEETASGLAVSWVGHVRLLA
jgi:hypothetical protein